MPSGLRRGWSIWSVALALGPMVLLIRARRPLSDNSYLWHVTAGEVQRGAGSVLTADPFSFTASNRPWRTQSWLADLGYSWAHDIWGLASGRWVPPLVGGLTFLVLAAIIRRRRRLELELAAVMGLTSLVMLPFLNPRPVIFSYLMLALAVLALESPKLTWTIPLITWAWAALHGSFFLVFVLLALARGTRPTRTLVSTVASSSLAALCTAHGLGVVSILLEFAKGNAALQRIQEWQPPDLLSIQLWPVLVALVLVIWWDRRNPMPGRRALGALAWFLFGLTANRSIPLMWIAVMPIIAEAAAHVAPRQRRSSTVPAPIVVVAMIATLGMTQLLPSEPGLSEDRFPVSAAEALTGSRVFHEDGVGGYLIYSQWPERQVYVDDRAELYHEQFVTYSETADGAPEWADEFRRWGVDQVLISVHRPLTQVLYAAGWQAIHLDEHFVVLDPPG